MKIITAVIQDKYNADKQWIISRSKCRHYSLSQVVNGQKTGQSSRCGLNWINQVIGEINK